MTKQTGTIITIIVGVLTLLCCTGPLCTGGILILADLGALISELDPSLQTGTIPQTYAIAPCCLSILVLVVPLLLWLFLVRGKNNSMPVTDDYVVGEYIAEEHMEGDIEEDAAV
ncbi:MAG: hypothetical protein SXV54_14535 [Chloroflexota bacterium]|nr:hypothetical protein [Chloroflexota bacterium]